MARKTIQIPINKSSNDGYVLSGSGTPLFVPTISELLYFGANCGFGLAWDGSVFPKNKKIVSVKLYIYSQSSYSQFNIAMKFAEFSEGSSIPSASPSDKTISSFSAGWNAIDIPVPTINSIVCRFIGYNPPPEYYDYVTLNSHRNSINKPYIEVTYDDIPPDKPTSLYPSGITLSTRDIIRFSWLHNSKEGLQQKGFTLEYSINGGSSWTTINQTTSNQFYDMPANTLPTSGAVMWRVRTIDGNDEVSEFASSSFTLGVLPQKAPIPISPISQYLDESKPIRFEWSFVGGSGSETQSKFDLQYSTNGGSTWTTKAVTTPNTFLELPANTFTGGNVLWRVRTYNNWNEVSPYSENKSFTVIGSPPVPQILDWTNSARPMIYWNSYNQQGYELQLLKDNEVIYDTGLIPGFAKSHKIPFYINRGEYKVRMRIVNEYNLNSDWAEKIFYLAWWGVEEPKLIAYSGEYGVVLKVDFDDPFKDEEEHILTVAKTLIYRDGVCIGETKDNTFTDYSGENNREYKYFARNVNDEKWEEDSFADSEIKLAKCKFNGNTLALSIYPDDFIKLKYGLDSIPKKTNSISNSGNLVYYDGREYPVVEYSEFRSKSKTVSFTLKTKEELNKLIELISSRKTLLFRDADGENIFGSIFDLEYNKTILGYYEVGFTITKTEV